MTTEPTVQPGNGHGTTPVSLVTKPLHPRHGVHRPVSVTPPRHPGSIRRTSTIDTLRPAGVLGQAVIVGRARDLLTSVDLEPTVLGEATLVARIEWFPTFELLAIESEPHRPELDALVGVSVSTGFRAAMAEAVPAEKAGSTLLHLLLDDLPGAALVAGHAVGAAGEYPERPPGDRLRLQVADLCAGFQRGGTIMREVDAGHLPPMVVGPDAPDLGRSDDACAWHAVDHPGPHGMRRRRRLDLTPGDALAVDVVFRDSHWDDAERETVIHEYSVTATVDPQTATVVDSAASAGALPWVECIEAEASGSRLSGMAVGALRPEVSATFVGTSTCTHLNDTLRSLEDLAALAALLDR